MAKLYDLVVKTGTYEKDGETKNRYKTVGAVMSNQDGGKFIMLDRLFNPAGVPNPDDRDTVILSMFEPRENDGGGDAKPKGNSGGRSGGGGAKPKGNGGGKNAAEFDDDIPF